MQEDKKAEKAPAKAASRNAQALEKAANTKGQLGMLAFAKAIAATPSSSVVIDIPDTAADSLPMEPMQKAQIAQATEPVESMLKAQIAEATGRLCADVEP